MESIYWVLTWACHRRCVHCYDDRFRPYVRDELKGDVYPCCIKAKMPLGNVTREALIPMLDDLANEPALQALNQGDPAQMGVTEGCTRAQFLAASVTKKPDGSDYANLCIGCDAYFEAKLGTVLRARAIERTRRHAVIPVGCD